MTDRHIVVPTDLSEGSAASFARVGALAADLGAHVTLLYVLQEPMAVPYGYPYVPEPTLAERTEYL
ncbi:MAG: universal stress protein, partial [Planctomycetes bacterium]|nr:universal stress protein [Planctomycetota bacterium]